MHTRFPDNHPDVRSRIAAIWILGLYIGSFFLPVGDVFLPVGGFGNIGSGWSAFVDVLHGVIAGADGVWMIFAPNVLLWLGIVFLWFRTPYLSFLLGLLATFIAAGVLVSFKLLPFPAHTHPFEFAAQHIGAYVWLASMLALTVAASWLSRWHNAHRWEQATTPTYPEICAAARNSAFSSHDEQAFT
jgi:hypothetical protein